MPQNQKSAQEKRIKRLNKIEEKREVPYLTSTGSVGFETVGKLAKKSRKKTAKKVPTTKQ